MKVKKDNKGTGLICAGLYDKIMAAYAAIRAYVRQQINDAISTSFKFKGTVATYYDLPECDSTDSTENCPEIGDTYNVIAAYDSPEFGEIPPGTNWAWNGEEWDPLAGSLADYLSKSAAAQTYATKEALAGHEADKNNPHEVTKSQVGLGNVDNTSDADKPVSTATRQALADKADTGLVAIMRNQDDSAIQVQEEADPITGGTENTAISRNALATGMSGTAGLKGYRYTNTGSVTNSLTFGTTPDGWAVGDVVSVINNHKYSDCVTIASISGTTVTFEGNLPFSSIVNESDWDSKVAYISAKPDKGDVNVGFGAHAEGVGSKALNAAAHAEGLQTKAYGEYSHAEGRDTTAQYAAHAEGQSTEALGTRAHSEGYDSSAVGNSSHAEGQHTKAIGQASHIEGHSAVKVTDSIIKEGNDSILSSWNSATSKFSLAKGVAAHVEGKDGLALDDQAHSEGLETVAQGKYSHAEGTLTKAVGNGSHVEGINSVAGGSERPSKSTDTTAGRFAHAEGNGTFAQGNSSHAEGKGTQALKPYSHAEGLDTTADGNKAHAEGFGSIAGGEDSHAEGGYTATSNRYEHAQGRYNKSNKANTTFGNAGNTLHSIGIGTADNARRNAVEVMQDGKVFIKNVGDYDGTNSSSTENPATDVATVMGTIGTKAEKDKILAALNATIDIGGVQTGLDNISPLNSRSTATETKNNLNVIMNILLALRTAVSVLVLSLLPLLSSGTDLTDLPGDYPITDYIDPVKMPNTMVYGYGRSHDMRGAPETLGMTGAYTNLHSSLNPADYETEWYGWVQDKSFGNASSNFFAAAPNGSQWLASGVQWLRAAALPARVPAGGVFVTANPGPYPVLLFLNLDPALKPFIRTPRLDNGIGTFSFDAKSAFNASGKIALEVAYVDDPGDSDWTFVQEWVLTPGTRYYCTNAINDSTVRYARIRRTAKNASGTTAYVGYIGIDNILATPFHAATNTVLYTSEYAAWEYMRRDVGGMMRRLDEKASTNDVAEAISSVVARLVEVVPPSTNPSDAGKAADAKSTGDALAGKASVADATLTPIYSDTPTFSEWVTSPPGTGVYWSNDKWRFDGADVADEPEASDPDATTIRNTLYNITATRTRTDIVGYVLGSQSDKPLQPKGEYAFKSEIPAVPVKVVKRNGTALTPDAQGAVDVSVPAVVAPSTSQSDAGKAADAKATGDQLTTKLSRSEAGLSDWSISPPVQTAWSVQFVSGGDSWTDGWYLVIDNERVDFYEDSEVATTLPFSNYTATRTMLPTMADLASKQDAIADLAAIRSGAALGATAVQPAALDAALAEAAQFKEWYPDGSITSYAQTTDGLKYDWSNADNVNHTVNLFPFCDTGNPDGDNSSIPGRVVIPPYVDHDGTRYTVVGGVSESEAVDDNNNLTTIVAPTTVTATGYNMFTSCTALTSASFPAAERISFGTFYGCTALTSVSLPAATEFDLDSAAFAGCTSLTTVDFGPNARSSVPAHGANAFPDLSQTGHTCRIIVPDDNYTAWVSNQDWSTLTSHGYQFTKSGGTYLKDANGIYWELTIGTNGTLGATAATNTTSQVSQ